MFHMCPITPSRLVLISSCNAAVSHLRRRRRPDHRSAAFGSAESREGWHYCNFLSLSLSLHLIEKEQFHFPSKWLNQRPYNFETKTVARILRTSLTNAASTPTTSLTRRRNPRSRVSAQGKVGETGWTRLFRFASVFEVVACMHKFSSWVERRNVRTSCTQTLSDFPPHHRAENTKVRLSRWRRLQGKYSLVSFCGCVR